jgi:hypothetical protein
MDMRVTQCRAGKESDKRSRWRNFNGVLRIRQTQLAPIVAWPRGEFRLRRE